MESKQSEITASMHVSPVWEGAAFFHLTMGSSLTPRATPPALCVPQGRQSLQWPGLLLPFLVV